MLELSLLLLHLYNTTMDLTMIRKMRTEGSEEWMVKEEDKVLRRKRRIRKRRRRKGRELQLPLLLPPPPLQALLLLPDEIQTHVDEHGLGAAHLAVAPEGQHLDQAPRQKEAQQAE